MKHLCAETLGATVAWTDGQETMKGVDEGTGFARGVDPLHPDPGFRA